MNRDGVRQLLGRLSSYSALISQAYYNGELIKDEDSARGIELLQLHKVLIPRGEGAYSLHSALRRFFDASLNIERLYGVGSELGVAFERLEQLIEALFEAAHAGQTEDRERLEDEIRQYLYEIADNLSADLAHLRMLVENRFATVHTLAEKKRQNAYYIGRTEKLVQAIELFTLSDIAERIQTQRAFDNIALMFHRQLQARLPSFRQNLNDILEVFRHYLFEYRQIEEHTRRVRSLWLYLQRHPVYEWQEWDAQAQPPHWLLHAKKLELYSHPWVRDPQYSEELAALAGEIAAPVQRLPVQRQRGEWLAEEAEVPVFVLQAKPCQLAIEALIAGCKAEKRRLSAVGWYKQHPLVLGELPISVWLQCVLEDLGPRKTSGLGIEVMVEELRDSVFSGNVIVDDVWVAPV